MTSTTPEKLPASEHVGLMTGYDELAIEKAFKTDFDSLRATTSLRALVFVDERRRGADDKTALKTAMDLPLKDLGDRFADEPDEVMDDEPTTTAGNGDSSAE